MSKAVISLFDVSKRFIIPSKKCNTLFEHIMGNIKRDDMHKTIWALDKVTIDIKKGETVGIIGSNGSGKSTLLRIIADIYKPTSGIVKVQGEMTFMLCLNSAFLPDLSLKENVFLFGAIMGLDRKYISRNFSNIVNFAELNEFVNAVMMNFSSGMIERLAFSIAMQACRDILLIDEILAVGDERFKEKCFKVIEGFKKEKKTMLFSSHDLGTIRRFCNKALLLDNGRVVAFGDVEETICKYIELSKIKRSI